MFQQSIYTVLAILESGIYDHDELCFLEIIETNCRGATTGNEKLDAWCCKTFDLGAVSSTPGIINVFILSGWSQNCLSSLDTEDR